MVLLTDWVSGGFDPSDLQFFIRFAYDDLSFLSLAVQRRLLLDERLDFLKKRAAALAASYSCLALA